VVVGEREKTVPHDRKSIFFKASPIPVKKQKGLRQRGRKRRRSSLQRNQGGGRGGDPVRKGRRDRSGGEREKMAVRNLIEKGEGSCLIGPGKGPAKGRGFIVESEKEKRGG